jgi:hypothetical protein
LINNKENYLPDELEAIEYVLKSNPDLSFKKCKGCSKEYPRDLLFFSKEKRSSDGYEGKCRKCRGKKGSLMDFQSQIIIKVNNDNPSDSLEKQYEHFLKENVLPSRNFISKNHKEIIKYLIEVKYNLHMNNVPKIITRDWCKQHGLYGTLLKKYKGIISSMIDAVYPNQLNEWEFQTIRKGYWNDEANQKKGIDYAIGKIMNDNNLTDIRDVPYYIDTEFINDNMLGGLMRTMSKAYDMLNKYYPYRFYAWQFNSDYTDTITKDKDTFDNAMKEYITEYVNVGFKNYPNVISGEYFYYANNLYAARFRDGIRMYYNVNIYKMLDTLYPNTFNVDQFYYMNHYPTLDGTIVKSEQERIVHHVLVHSQLDITYEDKEFRFHDSNSGVKYRPDWILRHKGKVIVVEYYGMLKKIEENFEGKNEQKIQEYFLKYIDKTKHKHDFYNQLIKNDGNYLYIDLYREDIKGSKKGMIDKFKQYGIELDIPY